MDLTDELQGLAAANALVHAVILAGFDRLGVVSVEQVRTVERSLPSDPSQTAHCHDCGIATSLTLL